MKTMSIEQVGALIKDLPEGKVLVLHKEPGGQCLVSEMDELKWEALSLCQNEEFMQYLDKCRTEGGPSISWEEVKKSELESA